MFQTRLINGKKVIPKNEHLPVEIFGFIPEDKGKKASYHRENKLCPITKAECHKKLTIRERGSLPAGHCSVSHMGRIHIICPTRFYEDDFRLLKEATSLFFKDEDNLVITPETQISKYSGRIDFLVVKINDKSIPTDLLGIEIQADQTTYTGKLTEALIDYNEKGFFTTNHYGYGLNTKNQIKTSLITQNLDKGPLFQKWNKKLVWILQDVLFDNFVKRYDFDLIEDDLTNSIVFLVYEMVFNEGTKKYELQLKTKTSIDVNTLFDTANVKVPKLESVLNNVNHKIKARGSKFVLD